MIAVAVTVAVVYTAGYGYYLYTNRSGDYADPDDAMVGFTHKFWGAVTGLAIWAACLHAAFIEGR